MTQAEWGRVYTLLSLAYPRTAFEAESAAVYHRALADLPAHEVQAAVDALIRSSRWLPTVAEIREQVREDRRGQSPPLLEAPAPTCDPAQADYWRKRIRSEVAALRIARTNRTPGGAADAAR